MQPVLTLLTYHSKRRQEEHAHVRLFCWIPIGLAQGLKFTILEANHYVPAHNIEYLPCAHGKLNNPEHVYEMLNAWTKGMQENRHSSILE